MMFNPFGFMSPEDMERAKQEQDRLNMQREEIVRTVYRVLDELEVEQLLRAIQARVCDLCLGGKVIRNDSGGVEKPTYAELVAANRDEITACPSCEGRGWVQDT